MSKPRIDRFEQRRSLSLHRAVPPSTGLRVAAARARGVLVGLAAGVALLAFVQPALAETAPASHASGPDAAAVAALDTEYQSAVARNDASTMGRILADDFILVLGNGTVHTRAELLDEARSGHIHWEQQKEIDDSQSVRVWGDTAVVTAKLWIKGTRDGQAFDRKLWFSDTYVRTATGWRYVFGQASLALPSAP